MKIVALTALLFSTASTHPTLATRQDECPANYPACPHINDVLAYCYKILSGPVYGWPGSAIANAEAPKVYTIPRTSQLMLKTDIDCVCSAENTTPTGWDAADKCYFCEIPNMTASDKEEYSALIWRWVVTCNTWGRVSAASAVTCWNSDLQQGCWVPS